MVKTFRPTTPSSRFLVLESREELTSESYKKEHGITVPRNLLRVKHSTAGRNQHGHITSRHRGGGHKKHYRIVDFRRDKANIPATIASIDYDPNRSARLALLHYADGEKRYIIAPSEVKVGDKVMSGSEAPFKPGCSMKLVLMPIGSTIHNIELVPGRGAQLVRSAGLSAQLMGRSEGYATIRMPSGEMRLVNENCSATLGTVSNAEHNLRNDGKAGRSRWKGIRPCTRGTAKNPVDHPHGGGNGRHNGYIPQTPWAVPTKGYKTRKKSKSTRFIVKDRRK
jgi:large subunit ribosomal protein L2